METVDDVILDTEEKMDNTVKVLKEQFAGLRTGKASPALVENVQVSYYGTPTRLRDIAGISMPMIRPRLPTSRRPSWRPTWASPLATMAASSGCRFPS
jgi:hypothetical protein